MILWIRLDTVKEPGKRESRPTRKRDVKLKKMPYQSLKSRILFLISLWRCYHSQHFHKEERAETQLQSRGDHGSLTERKETGCNHNSSWVFYLGYSVCSATDEEKKEGDIIVGVPTQ
jgi:hypothetical protein